MGRRWRGVWGRLETGWRQGRGRRASPCGGRCGQLCELSPGGRPHEGRPSLFRSRSLSLSRLSRSRPSLSFPRFSGRLSRESPGLPCQRGVCEPVAGGVPGRDDPSVPGRESRLPKPPPRRFVSRFSVATGGLFSSVFAGGGVCGGELMSRFCSRLPQSRRLSVEGRLVRSPWLGACGACQRGWFWLRLSREGLAVVGGAWRRSVGAEGRCRWLLERLLLSLRCEEDGLEGAEGRERSGWDERVDEARSLSERPRRCASPLAILNSKTAAAVTAPICLPLIDFDIKYFITIPPANTSIRLTI